MDWAHLEGIESIVIEIRGRTYVEHRVRAGVLEQGTVDVLEECGAGERMRREGLVHRGLELRFDGRGYSTYLNSDDSCDHHDCGGSHWLTNFEGSGGLIFAF